jgi:hypothetical protein
LKEIKVYLFTISAILICQVLIVTQHKNKFYKKLTKANPKSKINRSQPQAGND